VGGLLIPLVSIVCALTLLPVLLAAFGERLERARLLPLALAERRHAGELRLWTLHVLWAMRRAKVLAPVVAAVLLLGAMPLIGIHVGPGSHQSLPPGIPAMRGLDALQQGSLDRPRSSSTRSGPVAPRPAGPR
jgi:RND superfamily putative drug exporter